MLSNCLLRYKLQHSHGDIQSMSMSFENFNPGQTQQARQRECVSKASLRIIKMDERDTEKEKTLLFYWLQGVAARSARIYLL